MSAPLTLEMTSEGLFIPRRVFAKWDKVKVVEIVEGESSLIIKPQGLTAQIKGFGKPRLSAERAAEAAAPQEEVEYDPDWDLFAVIEAEMEAEKHLSVEERHKILEESAGMLALDNPEWADWVAFSDEVLEENWWSEEELARYSQGK